MFEKIFIEKSLKDNSRTLAILARFKKIPITYLDDYQEVWGKVKKPYLQKRESLNLFIASKKGSLVKETPPAYGLGDEKHYYFIHAYNCIYECQYCYLQGYFNTPDIVLFINHEDILSEMQDLVDINPDAWFHSGEYSDSLSLSHVTKELPLYFDFFKKNPKAKLEFRTKSSNIRELLKLTPLPNIFVSFTISSHDAGKIFDVKCPSVKHRLQAIKNLVAHGHMIGLHFDPLIYTESFEEEYNFFISELAKILPNSSLGYISIGVVRFTKDVLKEVEHNYPESKMLAANFTKSFDNKVRYNKPLRMWMMQKIKSQLIEKTYDSNKIYFCMEE